MPKTTRAGERPDASVVVTTRLRRLIAGRARKGETVGETLTRLFKEKGHRSIGKTGQAGRMLLATAKTTIRLPKALKSWIITHMKGYETPEHAILRLAGLEEKASGDANGR